MKVRIDATRCEGTGYCQAINDALFELDEDGVARTRLADDDPRLGELAADLLEAESLCPTGAITVLES